MRNSLFFFFLGCSSEQVIHGSDGNAGGQGEPGQDGEDGEDGTSCWDLNENGEPDPEEDINGDGNVDALDCQGFEDDDTGSPESELTAYFGDISFTSPEAMEAFCTQHDVIWGNVYILSEDFELTDIDGLECIEYIDGTLYIHGSIIENISLPNLTGVGDFFVTDADSLVSISLPLVSEIRGFVYLYYNTELTDVDLSGVTSVEQYFTIQSCGLTELDGFSSLETVGEYVYLYNNDSLTDVSGLMGITHVGGIFHVGENDNLADADIDALIEAIGESNIDGEVYTWDNGG
jgi:hypothetical protein